ncbi:MAG: hypothetical protein KAG66_23570, partial [Methylococcales bacterium]|nr:hypothetical protein [Methylococcales bacterium]
FVLGLLGRPSILRVYIPLVSLLVVAPFLIGRMNTLRIRIAAGTLLVASTLNATQVFSESKALTIQAVNTQEGLKGFPNEPIVTWGAAFPFEAVYPVIGPSPAESYQLYPLGVFTLAPFSVAFQEQKRQRSMIDLIVKEEGIQIIATDQHYDYLEKYCSERHHGLLHEITAQKYGGIVVSRRRCEAAP